MYWNALARVDDARAQLSVGRIAARKYRQWWYLADEHTLRALIAAYPGHEEGTMRPLLAAMRKVGAATKGALRPLRAAEAWLSSQPPLLFVIVYLVTRLRFGWWYYTLPPEQFYAPYARFEPAAQADAGSILRSLNELIQADIKNEPATHWQLTELTEAGSPVPTINPAGVYATRFEMLDDGTADFHVLVPAFLTDGTGAADRSEPYRPIWINVSFQALGGPIAGDTVLGSFYPLTLHTEKCQ